MYYILCGLTRSHWEKLTVDWKWKWKTHRGVLCVWLHSSCTLPSLWTYWFSPKRTLTTFKWGVVLALPVLLFLTNIHSSYNMSYVPWCPIQSDLLFSWIFIIRICGTFYIWFQIFIFNNLLKWVLSTLYYFEMQFFLLETQNPNDMNKSTWHADEEKLCVLWYFSRFIFSSVLIISTWLSTL